MSLLDTYFLLNVFFGHLVTAFKFFEGVILLTKYQAQFHRIKNSQNISETVSLLSITQNNYEGCIKFGIKNSIDIRTNAKC